MGYRKYVVRKDLVSSFPDITNKELKRFRHLFYKNLGDILLDGIWSFTISRKQILKHYQIINPEIIESLFDSDNLL